MDGVGPPSDFTGLSRRKWYFMAAGWSLLLLVPAIVALTSDAPVWLRLLQLLAVLGYAACYVFGLYEGIRRGSRAFTAALLVVMAALYLVLAGVGSGVFSVAFLVVGVIMLVPGRWGTVGAIAASAGAVLCVGLLTGALSWGDVIGTAAVCVAQIGMFGVIRINARLRAAQAELAELAVTAERERMARDLHDVLGHSLTTITVKAALARRLLEAGEQARAADEVADVERLGRQPGLHARRQRDHRTHGAARGGRRLGRRGPHPVRWLPPAGGVPARPARAGGRASPARTGAGVIRVLLADDQALVRGALAAMLGLEADIEVVAQVGSGAEVVAAAIAHRVDVALLDVQMPGGDGLDAAAELHAALPSCRIVILTTFGRPGYLARAMRAGASGFVVKDAPPEQLVDAVRRVHAGLRVVDPVLAAESLSTGASPLTERERDVLRAAADGATVATLAARLHLSEGTVRNHLSAAIGKTTARTRAEAVRLADEHGWL